MMRTYFLHVGLVAAILATSITHCAPALAAEPEASRQLNVSGSRIVCQRSVIADVEQHYFTDSSQTIPGGPYLRLTNKHQFQIDNSFLGVLRKADRVLVCEDSPSTIADVCQHIIVVVDYDANRMVGGKEGPHGTGGRKCGVDGGPL